MPEWGRGMERIEVGDVVAIVRCGEYYGTGIGVVVALDTTRAHLRWVVAPGKDCFYNHLDPACDMHFDLDLVTKITRCEGINVPAQP